MQIYALVIALLFVTDPLLSFAAPAEFQQSHDLLGFSVFRKSALLTGNTQQPSCRHLLASCSATGIACCPAGLWPGYCSKAGQCEGLHAHSVCKAKAECYSNHCVDGVCQQGESGSLCDFDSTRKQCASGLTCTSVPITRQSVPNLGVCEDATSPLPQDTQNPGVRINRYDSTDGMFQGPMGLSRIRRGARNNNGRKNSGNARNNKGSAEKKPPKRSGDYQMELDEYVNKKSQGDDDDNSDDGKSQDGKTNGKANRQQKREKHLQRIREKVKKTGKPRIVKVEKGPEKPTPQTRFSKISSTMDQLSITKISSYASTLNSLSALHSFDLSDDVNINHVYTNGPDGVTHQTDISDVSQRIEISNITQVTEQVNIVNITRYVTINYVVKIVVVDVVHELPYQDVIVTTHSIDVTNILDISHKISIYNTYEITHNVDISNLTKTSTSSQVDSSGDTTDIVNVLSQKNEVNVTDVTNVVNITNIEDVTDVRSISTTYEIVRVLAPSEKAAQDYLENGGETTVEPVQQRRKRAVALPWDDGTDKRGQKFSANRMFREIGA